jgi:murein L,D-transpeptidase YafK
MKLSLLITVLFFSLSTYSIEITRIIVLKSERTLQLWEGKNLYKTYPVKLSLSYNNPLFTAGPKRREGDMQTPVGFYKISKKRERTSYPKSLLISYPNEKDRHNARVLGIPEDQIGIGEETIDQWARDYFYPYFDWTNGCIAVADEDMNEIFELIKKDTLINIYP